MARRNGPRKTAVAGLSPAAATHVLTVLVPRGHEGFWAIIRTLDRAGPWTAAAVAAETWDHPSSVRDYLRRLVRAGIAREVGDGLYRLAPRPPADAPRLRRDGSACPPCGQQQMWRAMRALAQFTFAELAYAASTDEVRIDPVAARSYIQRLAAAGYLAVVTPAKTRTRPAVWRLKPGMNTGPKAPMICRTHLVWDPNRAAVMGGPARLEQVPA